MSSYSFAQYMCVMRGHPQIASNNVESPVSIKEWLNNESKADEIDPIRILHL